MLHRGPFQPILTSTLVLGCAIAIGFACTREAPSGPISADQAGATVKGILAIDDPLERVAELAPVFPRLSPDALPGVLQAYEHSGLDGGDPEIVLLGMWWARFDPAAAVRWTTTDWRAGYGAVLQAIYRSWGNRDPQEALRSARATVHPGQKDLNTDAAIAGWDESGQPGVEEYVRALPELDRQRFGEVLARRRVVSLGTEGALRWAESIEDPEFRKVMLRRVASAVAMDEPSVAARWAEPRITAAAAAGERPTGLPRRIATRWVRHDPTGAMAWLATLPAGKDRDDGVTESFRDWLRLDPPAATAWIEGVEMASWNGPAFYVYTRGYAFQRPAEMLAVASRISDPALRDGAEMFVARVWLGIDPEAAEAALANSTLSEESKTVARRQRYVPPKPEPNGPAAGATYSGAVEED